MRGVVRARGRWAGPGLSSRQGDSAAGRGGSASTPAGRTEEVARHAIAALAARRAADVGDGLPWGVGARHYLADLDARHSERCAMHKGRVVLPRSRPPRRARRPCALSRRTTAQPLYTRFATKFSKIVGGSISGTTTRPSATSRASRRPAPTARHRGARVARCTARQPGPRKSQRGPRER
jgi:hypothetical protein